MSSRSDRSEAARGAAAGPAREEAAVAEVRRAIRSIRFGSVLVKIHDGQVVGIETSTKLRLGDPEG